MTCTHHVHGWGFNLISRIQLTYISRSYNKENTTFQTWIDTARHDTSFISKVKFHYNPTLAVFYPQF